MVATTGADAMQKPPMTGPELAVLIPAALSGTAWEWDPLDRTLGEGKYAVLVRVTHRQTGVARACKIGMQKTDLDRLRREALLLETCAHPNVMRLIEPPRAKALFVCELAECDLFSRLTENVGLQGAAAATQALMSDLLAALAHMHGQGVVHMDVKADNVLLFASPQPGGREVAKLCDLGLSVQPSTQHAVVCGTEYYLAPEMYHIRKTDRNLPAHDMWSLGVLLYICMFGSFPWFKAHATDPNFQVLVRCGVMGLRTTLVCWGCDHPVHFIWMTFLDSLLQVDPGNRLNADDGVACFPQVQLPDGKCGCSAVDTAHVALKLLAGTL